MMLGAMRMLTLSIISLLVQSKLGVCQSAGDIAECSYYADVNAEKAPALLQLKTSRQHDQKAGVVNQSRVAHENPFEAFFDGHTEGHGIHKWRHYFPVYEKHLSKFIGVPGVRMGEIGVYSGGSLEMWKGVLGEELELYAFDITPSVKVYESYDPTNRTHIFIGNQNNESFWADVFTKIPPLDILIDDGSHAVYDQLAALKGVFAHLRPGGVYITEDIHGNTSGYPSMVLDYLKDIHALESAAGNWTWTASAVQDSIEGIYMYPYLCVIEKRTEPRGTMHADHRGTQWEPIAGGVTQTHA